jgi:hypothetical protein
MRDSFLFTLRQIGMEVLLAQRFIVKVRYGGHDSGRGRGNQGCIPQVAGHEGGLRRV